MQRVAQGYGQRCILTAQNIFSALWNPPLVPPDTCRHPLRLRKRCEDRGDGCIVLDEAHKAKNLDANTQCARLVEARGRGLLPDCRDGGGLGAGTRG
jgi:hypothetical protein